MYDIIRDWNERGPSGHKVYDENKYILDSEDLHLHNDYTIETEP